MLRMHLMCDKYENSSIVPIMCCSEGCHGVKPAWNPSIEGSWYSRSDTISSTKHFQAFAPIRFASVRFSNKIVPLWSSHFLHIFFVIPSHLFRNIKHKYWTFFIWAVRHLHLLAAHLHPTSKSLTTPIFLACENRQAGGSQVRKAESVPGGGFTHPGFCWKKRFMN